jgi:hypothetical protein
MLKALLDDYWYFLRFRKRYWLLPVIVIMLLMGVIAYLADDSAIAPLIYVD